MSPWIPSRLAATLAAALLAGTAASQATAPTVEALREAAEAVAGSADRRERLAALGRAAAAQEATLADLRAELRTLTAEREAALDVLRAEGGATAAALAARARLARLTPAALAAHPQGPAGAARAASILAAMTPDLAREAAAATAALDRVREVEARRRGWAEAVEAAAAELAGLRAEIETAAVRGRSPAAALSEAAASLEAAAQAAGPAAPPSALADDAAFRSGLGQLPPPALGRLAERFGESGADGRAQGVRLEASAWSLVYAPTLSTVRFAGPVPGSGLTVVLEPARGALILLSGLGELSVRPGEVVPPGAPLGALSGSQADAEFVIDASAPDSTISPASLYIETRRDGRPVDPADWFAFTTERTSG